MAGGYYYARAAITMQKKWSNADVNRFLGSHSSCYLTYSNDEKVRNGSASGGSTTQILIELLRTGYIDGALVWTMGTRDERPYAVPVIATTAKELLAARTSVYVATYFARDAMPLLQGFEGRVAVLTLPCDASYLRRRMQRKPELKEKIAGILTLFCGHNSLPELTETVCARHGFAWNDLKNFTYRTGSWRGTLTMEPKVGKPVTTSTQQFTHLQNLHFFSEKKCQACFDHFGFDSDISLGDSWALGERNRDIKPTVCVVRNETGARMLAAASTALNLTKIAPEHVLAGNSRGLLYHYNVSARAKVAAGMNRSINDRVHVPTSMLERLIARMGVGNALWTWRNPHAQRTLEKLPFAAIKAYIYTFKGMQEISSYAWRQYPNNRQISLIGATLTGNQGAAAMLETSIGEISRRYPEAHFVVHSYFPAADRLACNASNVRIVDATPKVLVLSALPALIDGLIRHLGLRLPNALMPESLRELRNSAVLLDISGISLADGREKFLPFNLLCTWPATLTGAPVVKLSQAMGPARKFLTRHFSRFIFRRTSRIFARGSNTLELITAVAPEEKCAIAADIAFLYQNNYALLPQWSNNLDSLIRMLAEAQESILTISVSTVVAQMAEKCGQNYVDTIGSTIEKLVDDGYRIVVFPNACREGTNSTHNNDIPVIRAIGERIGKLERAHLVDYMINTAAIRTLLGTCDALITSRFHAMVAGLGLGVPTLVLGWSHKYQEVMATFGTEEHYLGWDEMNADALVSATKDLVNNKQIIQQNLLTHIEQVRASSASQFDWLNEFLQPEVTELDA